MNRTVEISLRQQQVSKILQTCYFSNNFPRGASGLHLCDTRMGRGKGRNLSHRLFKISVQFDRVTHCCRLHCTIETKIRFFLNPAHKLYFAYQSCTQSAER